MPHPWEVCCTFKNPQEGTITPAVPVIRLSVQEAEKRQDLNPAPRSQPLPRLLQAALLLTSSIVPVSSSARMAAIGGNPGTPGALTLSLVGAMPLRGPLEQR